MIPALAGIRWLGQTLELDDAVFESEADAIEVESCVIGAEVVACAKGESVADLEAEFGIGVVANSFSAESLGSRGDCVIGVVESGTDGNVRLKIGVEVADIVATEGHHEPNGVAGKEHFVAVFGLADEVEIGANVALNHAPLLHGRDADGIPLAA